MGGIRPDNWITPAWGRSLATIMEGEKPPLPQALIGNGFIPRRTLAVLYGGAGVRKTWLTLAFALNIALGRDILGWPTTRASFTSNAGDE